MELLAESGCRTFLPRLRFCAQDGHVMTQPWNQNGPTYRGSSKHKRRPVGEVKGTYCPQWSHETASSGLGNDMAAHDWENTLAAAMFAYSTLHPGGQERRYATKHGIAFEAKPSNDGSWHGYPIPWQSVPTAILSGWKKAGLVKAKHIRAFWKDGGKIDWAMVTDA